MAQQPKSTTGSAKPAQTTQAQPQSPGKESSSTGYCGGKGCKHLSASFGFCAEHYDHFKFGLITKKGEPVLDYDKKFEHYQAYKAKKSARKAA